jgi:hypothetical protein
MKPISDWREQEAVNETVFREMNEWTLEDHDARLGLASPIDAFLCECSDRQCTDPIRLTRAEYEHVRAEGVRFAIALRHENPEIDRLLSENDRYAVVEKFYGAPARIARESDPRR